MMLIALLTAAWVSPSCCQRTWAAAEAVRVTIPGEKTCQCCKKAEQSPEQDGCCEDSCQDPSSKMIGSKAGVDRSDEGITAAILLAWAYATPMISVEPSQAVLVAAADHDRIPRLDATLLGQGCALTV